MPITRCCAQHSDWATLTQHLLAAFPAVDPADVVSEVVEARAVSDRFSLETAEALELAEVIVRHKLMLLTGEAPDAARLDPQLHVRRDGDLRAHSRSATDVT